MNQGTNSPANNTFNYNANSVIKNLCIKTHDCQYGKFSPRVSKPDDPSLKQAYKAHSDNCISRDKELKLTCNIQQVYKKLRSNRFTSRENSTEAIYKISRLFDGKLW